MYSIGNFDKAGKCLFLCLRDDYGCYAVQVPCIRPTEPNRFDRLVIKSFGKEEQSQKKHSLDKAAFESDAAIWRRMIKICFDNKGQWKKWLPFYGPIDVEEVNVWMASTLAELILIPLLISFSSLEWKITKSGIGSPTLSLSISRAFGGILTRLLHQDLISTILTTVMSVLVRLTARNVRHSMIQSQHASWNK